MQTYVCFLFTSNCLCVFVEFPSRRTVNF